MEELDEEERELLVMQVRANACHAGDGSWR